MIQVQTLSQQDPMRFEVRVEDDHGSTRHEVTMRRADWQRLGGGAAPDTCIEAAFRFLLEREPKESILQSFDVTVISRYFPEFEQEFPRYL
jgi:hypothetical protein